MLRRRLLFLFGSRSFEIREGGEAGSRAERWDGAAHALLWLRAAADAAAIGALRRFCAESGGVGIAAHLDDDDVLRHVAALLASGRAQLVERPLGVLSSFGDAATADDGEGDRPADSDREAPAERTWITIELVGEDDAPIPGERYRIELPDGSVREGRLDGRGLARVREIDPGQCVVTFPDLDEAAWSSIGTTGEP